MNLYEKMQKVKTEILQANLKKSGENKFAKYTYYELADFLPAIVQACTDNKLFTQILFTQEEARLIIINAENPEEKIEYTSPVTELELKGCNKVQAMGGVQTYIRRYLYMNAFDIVENDMFDAVTVENKTTNKVVNDDLITPAQAKRLFALGKGHEEIIREVMQVLGYEHSKDIKKKDYDEICKQIERAVQAIESNNSVFNEIENEIEEEEEEEM